MSLANIFSKLLTYLIYLLNTAEMMKKRFSKDLMGKERYVWIEPRTKSIHWYEKGFFFLLIQFLHWN